MHRGLLLLIALASLHTVHAQTRPYVKWAFATDGKVLSHPVVSGSVVYFGSSDKSVYAVDVNTGTRIWSYATSGAVRGPVLVHNQVVYVASENVVYALDKHTGKEMWTFTSNSGRGAHQLDPWDYHTGAPVMRGSTLYVGLGDGHVYGLDALSGALVTAIATVDSVPVRSGLVIEDATLYFGDWNGRIYAFDLDRGTRLWIYHTFETRPYDTFGAVNTRPAIAGNVLVFGGRNPELHVLDKKTGAKRWSYTEQDGGWISGDPLVVGDTLYIGGSDNHEMFAFNVQTGERYWTYKFLFNNFSRPLAYKDVLLFTIGDAYTVFGSSTGRGYLYALDRFTGSVKNIAVIGGNAHTSPVLQDGLLLVGSEDHHLYAIDVDAFVGGPFRMEDIGYNAGDIVDVTPTPFDAQTLIRYKVLYRSDIEVRVADLNDSTITVLYSGNTAPGEYTVYWDGSDDTGHEVEDGHYAVKVCSKDYYKTAFVEKRKAK
jgi:outer membrane protein assembly factor BamB